MENRVNHHISVMVFSINTDLKADKLAKSKPTRASRTSDSFLPTAGPQTFQVQITNVNIEVDADSIKEFIDNTEL